MRNKKKPYEPNNWRLIKNAPEELFPTPSFDEFMEERVETWELRDGIVAINRVYNNKTGKVTEKAYQQVAAAQKYLANKITEDHYDIATATQYELYFFAEDGEDG